MLGATFPFLTLDMDLRCSSTKMVLTFVSESFESTILTDYLTVTVTTLETTNTTKLLLKQTALVYDVAATYILAVIIGLQLLENQFKIRKLLIREKL